MHYWNKENFDGLKAIAEKYLEKYDYINFAEYCRNQELGLRKKALQSLRDFIVHLDSLEYEKQKAMAKEIIELQYLNRNIHQLSSHLLQQKLIAIFEAWIVEVDAPADPFRWLAYLKNESQLYEEALKRESTDQISLCKLTDTYLDRVDYQLHHLGDSLFLGSVDDAELCLMQAQHYLKKIESEHYKEYYTKEFDELFMLLDLWKKYSGEESQLTFPDWSRIEGYELGFSSTYNYGDSQFE